MTDSNVDLDRLVAALRAARDPWSRLRLVAGGARSLARLQPGQRRQLLEQLGLDGAEQLAELAAGGDAQAQAALERALQRLEADPRRLQQLANAIADPSSRRSTLSGLAAHLLEAVTDPGSTAHRAGAPPAKREQPARATTGGATAQAGVAAPSPTVTAGSAPFAAAASLPPPPAIPSSSLQPPAAGGSAPEVAAAALVAPGAVVAAPVPITATAAGVAGPSGPGAVAPGAPAADSAESARAVVHVDVDAIDPLAPMATPPPAPWPEGAAGWTQRRALADLLRRGAPPLVDALALVAQVASAADRRWALCDVAASRAWSDAEWECVLAAGDTPALRRRLAARRRRA
jgi:hypothetical protein